MSVRKPSVAGTFYPGDPGDLRRDVRNRLREGKREPAFAVVVPHAGYRYSGDVAGETFSRVAIPPTIVLLCFHHRGRGRPISIWAEGSWETPLGKLAVDGDLASRIRAGCPGSDFDEEGHRDEHSGEVQVPFLQVLRPDVRIVPIAVNLRLEEAEEIAEFGRALARVLKGELVVCSTDLNHYADHDRTVRLDEAVIEPMTRLDHEGLVAAIRREGVSMCGYAPTIATLAYAKARGAVAGTVVEHRTSGETGGDRDRCVGYVGMTICGN